jgi:hypothetical protein
MAIQFTRDRYFSTDGSFVIMDNVPVASQSFKLRIDSCPNPAAVPWNTNVLTKFAPPNGGMGFDFNHMLCPMAAPAKTVLLRMQLNGAGGGVQADVPLTVGVVYVIALTWDGNNGIQTAYVNGIPYPMGSIKGNTTARQDPMSVGPDNPGSDAIVFTVDDHCVWNNYLLPSADVTTLVNNGDPTTIGGTATWRGRWTLSGTAGSPPAIGDAGLKNAYGGGAPLTTQPPQGDGSDAYTISGAGTATYSAPLVWAPSVTAHPYVAMSGKVICATFTANSDGSAVVPLQIVTTPHLILNGTDMGPLGTPWQPPPPSTGIGPTFPLYFAPTPNNVYIGPNDTAALSAPSAWCNTPAGAVSALSGPIDNRSGKSSFQTEKVTPTLPVGMNIGLRAPLSNGGYHYPWKNWRYRMAGWPPGNRGKVTQPVNLIAPPNGVTAFACPYVGATGLWLIAWIDNNNGTDWQLASNNATSTTVTELAQYRNTMAGTNRKCRVYDVEHVPNQPDWSVSVQYGVTGPGGVVDYDDLWLVMPGDFQVVGGQVVMDTSDPLALSKVFTDRIPSNCGSMRAIDMTTGGMPDWFQFPENRHQMTDQFWGDLTSVSEVFSYASIGPVDPVATPYVYGPQFKCTSSNLFAATLGADITTAPAVGTHETITISDAATAPVFAGLELLIDSEWIRVISGSGTQWTVYRGSNGTTPAPHTGTPRTIQVAGRIPLSTLGFTPGTGRWPYLTTATWTTVQPHNRVGYEPTPFQGGGPTLAFDDGSALDLNGFGGQFSYITGPNTFLYRGASTSPNGGVLTQTYTLNPSVNISSYLDPTESYCPHGAFIDIVSRYPNCIPHVNLWPNASDDLSWTVAREVRDRLPVGRGVLLEYSNEPWNWAFGSFAWLGISSYLWTPPSFKRLPYPSDGTSPGTIDMINAYVYNAMRHKAIWQAAFAEKGRQDEVGILLNVGLTGPSQYHLQVAQMNGWSVDYIAIAPYTFLTTSDYNSSVINTYDNQQALDMFAHDLFYNPNNLFLPNYANHRANIAAYNAATGNHCKLLGYEGGASMYTPIDPSPNGNQYGTIQGDARNRDMQYDPLNYIVELDTYRSFQDAGFDLIHLYGLSAEWHPEGWGLYHWITQPHGRGDGVTPASDGFVYDNRTQLYQTGLPGSVASPDSPERRCSVRGQAYIDWLKGLRPTQPRIAPRKNFVTRSGRRNRIFR